VWTGDESLAQSVAPVLTLLSIGSALHGVMYFPYALQLASGIPRLALKINMILLCVLVPTTALLASHLGAFGGALAWLLLHMTYVLLGTWMTHRRLLVGMGAQWLVSDVLVPLAISAAIVLAAHYLVERAEPTDLVTLAIAVGTTIVAVVSCLATSPKALRLVVNAFSFRKSTAPNLSS
jgi:O-antigen/teichoic acid export membrane protein